MNEDARRNVRNVMTFALADGELNADERDFIRSLWGKLGLSDAEAGELVRQVGDAPGQIALPGEPAGAAEAVGLLVDLAAADGDVNDAERRGLLALGRQAGMIESAVLGMIAQAESRNQAAETEINAAIEDIYAQFAQWDEAARRAKIAELGARGPVAVIPLLRLLESYRTPQGAADALDLKILLAEELGRLGDERAAFYLAQQVNIGDVDDEVTNTALRCAAAEALGLIVGEDFSRDQQGALAARKWWFATGVRRHDRLAY